MFTTLLPLALTLLLTQIFVVPFFLHEVRWMCRRGYGRTAARGKMHFIKRNAARDGALRQQYEAHWPSWLCKCTLHWHLAAWQLVWGANFDLCENVSSVQLLECSIAINLSTCRAHHSLNFSFSSPYFSSVSYFFRLNHYLHERFSLFSRTFLAPKCLQCIGACGEMGFQHRVVQCVWYRTSTPAGAGACADQHRPPTHRECRNSCATIGNVFTCQRMRWWTHWTVRIFSCLFRVYFQTNALTDRSTANLRFLWTCAASNTTGELTYQNTHIIYNMFLS